MWDIIRPPCRRVYVIFLLRTKTRWYEVWRVLYLFSELIVSLGSLTWEHMGLILGELWGSKLDCQLAYWWEHLLDIHLMIQLEYILAWYLAITLAPGKDIWFEFTPWISKSLIWDVCHSAGIASYVVVWLWSSQLLVLLPPSHRFSQSYLLGGTYFLRSSLWRFYPI